MRNRTLLLIALLSTLLCSISCKRESEKILIGVSQCSDDQWRSKMNREMLSEALFYNNLDVEIRTARDDNQTQVEDIAYFISKGVDLLIVAPNQSDAITPIIEDVYKRGIPVVVVDRAIDSENYTAYIGADNYEIGKTAGNYIADVLGGKGRVIEVTGLEGSSPALARHQGFLDALTNYPRIEVVATIDGRWLKDTAYIKSDSLFRKGTDADVVFAQNDQMAIGAYEAAIKSGKELFFVGVDAISDNGHGLDNILNGSLQASFIYPTGGEKIVQTAMNILEGKPYEKDNILSTALVDSSNAKLLKLQTNHIQEQGEKIEHLNALVDVFWKRNSVQSYFLYACVATIVLFLIILILIVQAYNSKIRTNKILFEQKQQLEEQRDQLLELSRQLEEATHAKLLFFTNVSHDFRTPLTLIVDPVEQLLEEPEMSDKSRSLLKVVEKNSALLLRLVNQILDIRKYENGNLSLNLSTVDMAKQLEEWSEAFTTLARQKHIRFKFNTSCQDGCVLSLDVEKIERVYFNLLANAFKFTPENGDITVTLSKSESSIFISIEDSGKGIPCDMVDKVFDNFYQIDNKHNGSGIGLALSKSFVELHKGVITVQSREGQGSIFTIELPSVVVGSVEEVAPVKHTAVECVIKELSDSDFSEDVATQELQRVLVIDDNNDIRDYVKSLLQNSYNIIEATNGREGVKMAMKYVPDLIICDVMMPVMDGLECCKQLKGELQTSHIPVLMLTASSIDEQRIASFESGADSYISKPFNSQVLLVRIKNLIDNRHRLKNYFGDNIAVSQDLVSDVDKSFLDRLKELIESNLSNAELSVEELGGSMGLGRVQLYRKVKALTNYSPVELLRITRLKRASSLLSSTEKSVSEIAYEVGFSSPSYFTKCYKEYFGESPTDLLKRRG